MKLSRTKLIQFYDEHTKDKGRGSDVSALTALWGEDLLLGILQHFWLRQQQATSEILSYTCTTGKRSGPRLDGWLLKRDQASGREQLYQVEVKNWAAHSFGGKHLGLNATEQALSDFCQKQWAYFFAGETIPQEVAKVLAPMKPPERHENKQSLPLLCFWFYISETLAAPFCTRRYADGQEVSVFSASAYLRSLSDEFIEIDMPRAERRLNLLRDMIAPDSANPSLLAARTHSPISHA
jgi:hypothetical protein